jgi:RNA polymerase sigma factor FliA
VNPGSERIYRQQLDLLEEIVQWMRQRLGRFVPLEDLRAHAHDGLLEALQTYDPARSSAPVYFGRKMRWAILDAYRRERRMHQLRSRASAILASERLSFADEDVPDEPGTTEEEHVAALDAKLDKHAAGLVIGLLASRSGLLGTETTPEEHSVWVERNRTIRTIIETLPERERQILVRHYFDGDDFEVIAKELGISKSWTSRLHAQAIETLGKAFRERHKGES